MINEIFLEAAVRIRRDYLKATSNMNLYKSKAESMLEVLEEHLDKIKELEDMNLTERDQYKEVIKILKNLETESDQLEKLTEPLNKEIEKLGKEEAALYERITNKHSDLSEEEIVNCVTERLRKENLL